MQQNLLLSTPTDPKILEKIFNEGKEFISKVTLVSIDFPPIEIFENINFGSNHRTNQTIFNKKQNQAVMFDVVGLIVDGIIVTLAIFLSFLYVFICPIFYVPFLSPSLLFYFAVSNMRFKGSFDCSRSFSFTST